MDNPHIDRAVVIATLSNEYDQAPTEETSLDVLVGKLKECFEGSIAEEGAATRFRCETCHQSFFEPPDDPREECPFCGSPFADDDIVEPQDGGGEAVVAGGVGNGVEELDAVLRDCRTLDDVSRALKNEFVNLLDRGYRLGWLLRTVRDRELWRMGEGYRSFQDYYESIGIRHSTAYDLMKIVDVFAYGDFITIGRAKLAIVASVPPEFREPMLTAAREGASKTDINAMAKEAKAGEGRQEQVDFVGPEAAAGAKSVHGGMPERPPRATEDDAEEEGPWSTLVTKLKLDVPVEIPFLSRRHRGEETVKFDPSDVYLERVLSPRIALQIELNTNEAGQIYSTTWTFRKTE